MSKIKENVKHVGKYSVYKWEYYDGVYNYRTDRVSNDFDYTQVAVFISGQQKSLQKSTDYSNKKIGQKVYANLNSVKNIEKWIRD